MKKVFQILAMLAFLMVLGTVGGIEHGSIGFFGGSILVTAFMAAWVLFCKLGGLFYGR